MTFDIVSSYLRIIEILYMILTLYNCENHSNLGRIRSTIAPKQISQSV